MSDEGQGRTSRAEWAKRIERWQDSGLSAQEFGTELGVNPRTLTYWKWLLKKEAQGVIAARKRPVSKETAPAFVEIHQTPSGSMFELALGNGRRLQIPAAFDASSLERLLVVLEQN